MFLPSCKRIHKKVTLVFHFLKTACVDLGPLKIQTVFRVPVNGTGKEY